MQFLCVTLIEKLITEWADTTLAASLCCCKKQSTQNSFMVSRTKTPRSLLLMETEDLCCSFIGRRPKWESFVTSWHQAENLLVIDLCCNACSSPSAEKFMQLNFNFIGVIRSGLSDFIIRTKACY